MKKRWYEETILSELKGFIAEHGTDVMPSNLLLMESGRCDLANAIQKHGGYKVWAEKVGLDHIAKNRFDWTDEAIKQGIHEAMAILNVNRMPTANELQSIGKVTLANAISRSRRYSGWAEYLGLGIKTSESKLGAFYEEFVKNLLHGLGFIVEMTSSRYPYDILVGGSVKIDVKAGKVRASKGFKATSFGINKDKPTCDLFVLVQIGEDDTVEKVFVVPSHHINSTTITLGRDSKYDIYIDRWDYLGRYLDFHLSV